MCASQIGSSLALQVRTLKIKHLSKPPSIVLHFKYWQLPYVRLFIGTPKTCPQKIGWSIDSHHSMFSKMSSVFTQPLLVDKYMYFGIWKAMKTLKTIKIMNINGSHGVYWNLGNWLYTTPSPEIKVPAAGKNNLFESYHFPVGFLASMFGKRWGIYVAKTT